MDISFILNTYNRPYLLKNLVDSFFETYKGDYKYEWVIINYGKYQKTLNLLEQFKKFKNFIIINQSEDEYFDYLKSKNLQPLDSRQKGYAILGKWRNLARKYAQGKYIFELADDQQFVTRRNWYQEIEEIFYFEKKEISSLVVRAHQIRKYKKVKDKLLKKKTSNNQIEYFIDLTRNYDDYHIQKKETHKKLGPYFEIDKCMNSETVSKWKNKDYNINHYYEYLRSLKNEKCVKIFLKKPILLDMPNEFVPMYEKPNSQIIFDINSCEEKINQFNLDRPISFEELISSKNKIKIYLFKIKKKLKI